MGENISVIIRLKSVSICRVYLCPKNCTVCGETNDGQPCGVGELGKNESPWGGHDQTRVNRRKDTMDHQGPTSDLSTDPVFLVAKFDLFKPTNLSGQIG